MVIVSSKMNPVTLPAWKAIDEVVVVDLLTAVDDLVLSYRAISVGHPAADVQGVPATKKSAALVSRYILNCWGLQMDRSTWLPLEPHANTTYGVPMPTVV